MQASGFIVAAPATGSGKTVLTTGLIRAFRRRGRTVGCFKTGPDYIDPAFHARAAGRPCLNLDPWSMRLQTLAGLATDLADEHDLLVGEGVMGLFDGALDGTGSTADLAALLGLPVVLVIDAGTMGASVAALARGFIEHRDDVEVAALILNRVASPRQARMLIRACDDHLATPILGWFGREPKLALPSRHLGLVQAREHADLDAVIDHAADLAEQRLDLDRLERLAARPTLAAAGPRARPLAPFGQRIAVARDDAFAFAYPTILDGWRADGAEVMPFSPLADEPPPETADAVYLPGGYPELHAGRLAAATRFMDGLRRAAARGAAVYGECGGYMVLGRALTDKAGVAHAMAGLLPVETSFAAPKLHIGYRQVRLRAPSVLGEPGQRLRGHEFHYASQTAGEGSPLLDVTDALGGRAAFAGAVDGRVAGSFVHMVDRAV